MALSPADQTRLDRLSAARDRLLSGEAVAEVQSGGRSKKFAQADMAQLTSEIRALQDLGGAAVTGRRQRGAIRFRWRW